MVSEMMAQGPDVVVFIPDAGVVLCHLTMGCGKKLFEDLMAVIISSGQCVSGVCRTRN